jgi:hypothetical protein
MTMNLPSSDFHMCTIITVIGNVWNIISGIKHLNFYHSMHVMLKLVI